MGWRDIVTHLLVENGLCLTTITRLLPVVTALSLGELGIFALLVLGHLMEPKWIPASVSIESSNVYRRRTCASCMLCPCSLIHGTFKLSTCFYQRTHKSCDFYDSVSAIYYWGIEENTHLGMLTILLATTTRALTLLDCVDRLVRESPSTLCCTVLQNKVCHAAFCRYRNSIGPFALQEPVRPFFLLYPQAVLISVNDKIEITVSLLFKFPGR